MNVQFVPLQGDIVNSAFDIHCQGHPEPWSESVFLSCLTAPYYAKAMELNGEILGYWIGLQVLDEVTLMDIAVWPHARGQGLGHALMQEFLRCSLQRNAEKVWLEVRASNASAIALYRHHSFDLIETRKDYYQRGDAVEDALVMCLRME